MRDRATNLLTVLTVIAMSTAALAGDWPQWRGPDRSGVSKETGLLQDWPTGGPKQVWLFKDAGLGYSSFSIVDNRLFSMGSRDGVTYIFALNALTGKPMWSAKVGTTYNEGHGNGPRATPTIDGDYLYAMSGNGDLVCLKVNDGSERWRCNMKDFGGGRPHWGYTESVVVDGDKVVCTPGGGQGAMVALNKNTGKLVWQAKGFTDGAQYTSIVPADIGGVHQYVALTQQHVVGVAAEDGKVLWQSAWPGRTAVVPTPIVDGNSVYVTSGYGVGCKLVNVSGGQASDAWKQSNVMANHHGGVVLVDGHLYGYSDRGGWTCQDIKTGEDVWQNRGIGKGAIAYADGRLYCLSESSGTVALIEASTDGWKEHGQFKLSPQSDQRSRNGKVWTHPVIANGRLYLRDQELIYCFDIKAKSSAN